MRILAKVSKWEAMAASPSRMVRRVPGGYAIFNTKEDYRKFMSGKK